MADAARIAIENIVYLIVFISVIIKGYCSCFRQTYQRLEPEDTLLEPPPELTLRLLELELLTLRLLELELLTLRLLVPELLTLRLLELELLTLRLLVPELLTLRLLLPELPTLRLPELFEGAVVTVLPAALFELPETERFELEFVLLGRS